MFAHSFEIYLTIYAFCCLAFTLFAYDKHLAYYHKRRIPEIVLFLVSVPLSAFGSLCGMILFKHKTRKPLFTIGVPLLLLVQILGMAYRFTR